MRIHCKTNCPNAKALEESKKANVTWKENENEDVKELRIYCQDKIGLLAQILNEAAKYDKIKIISVNTKPKLDKIEILFHIVVKNKQEYEAFLLSARKIKGVLDVQRGEE